MTLIEDFNIWWEMPKFDKIDIPAKEYSDVEIVERHGSNKGWPGPEKNVHYWVELENGMAVGIITPKKKPATFPFLSDGIMPTRSKYDNEVDRGAGTGIIKKGAVPFRRGYWNVYETTTPYIGLFERSFWLEIPHGKHQHDSKTREAALEDLSYFFDENMKDNLIMLDFSSIRVMGGVASLDGQVRAGRVYREDKERNKKRKPKFPRCSLNNGYELRLSERDAVTFLTLWKGFDGTDT